VAVNNLIDRTLNESDRTNKIPNYELNEGGLRLRTYRPVGAGAQKSKKLIELLNLYKQINTISTISKSVRIGSKFIMSAHDMLDCYGYAGSRDEFKICTVVDGVTCEKCGQVIQRTDLENHQVTIPCFLAYSRSQLENSNSKPIANEADVIEVRKVTSIPSTLLPTACTLYVPTWVHAAIVQYKKEGYAGMSLSEFLTRLSTDHKA
jgi:hypothetical protein